LERKAIKIAGKSLRNQGSKERMTILENEVQVFLTSFPIPWNRKALHENGRKAGMNDETSTKGKSNASHHEFKGRNVFNPILR
jgi:hypothetical protein